jgi:serine/threonine protein kinase
MAEVLDILWARRIVHRDIKPANILRRSEGSFILIDFGIAKFLDRTTYTRWGMSLGTPGYMSPEQVSAPRSLTVKSDIFALGITAFESICGTHPFSCNQQLIMQNSAHPTASAVRGCSNRLSDLLEQTMQYRAVFRPGPRDIIRILR